MSVEISPDVRQHVCSLVTVYPGIREVWLLGSRANGSWTAESDWDLLLFANKGVAEDLKSNPLMQRSDVDYLVLTNEEEIERFGAAGSGSLVLRDFTGLDWKAVTDTEATYIARGRREMDLEPEVRASIRRRAFRIFPVSKA